ncbi:MAG: MBL fold metallo-hydrolase [Myxococcota bacterium]
MKFRGLRRERVLASPQHNGRRFANPTGKSAGLKGNPLPVMGEYFFGGGRREPTSPLPVCAPHEAWRRPSEALRVTWLGHSTVLLEMDGFRVLTDPVFGPRASPVGFAGPRRFHPMPAPLGELPPLDVVLLSHDHYDHLCSPTMKQLASARVPIVTCLGVGARLEAMGIGAERIVELDWHEHADVAGIRLHATPSQHFSGRTATDRNMTLWAAWVVETENTRVFLSGDTGLTDAFKATAAKHGPFDLTMLEVGAFHESWGDIHLGPENALRAFDMLGGGTLLPVHWGTFNLALHDWDEPAETLITLAGGRRIVTPRIGEVFELDSYESTAWWRGIE